MHHIKHLTANNFFSLFFTFFWKNLGLWNGDEIVISLCITASKTTDEMHLSVDKFLNCLFEDTQSIGIAISDCNMVS